MFNNLEYINFKNDVPNSLNSVAKNCYPFNVSIPISKDWDKSKRKLLVITGHTTQQDITNKKLLSQDSKTLINNCINHAEHILEPYAKLKDFSYAAINFNFFKNYHLYGEALQTSDEIQCNRVLSYIEKIKPTHILICGSKPSSLLLQGKVDLPLQKTGWVHSIEFKKHKCYVTANVDFSLALEDSKENKNNEESENEKALIGCYQLSFFCRNLASLLNSAIPWGIQEPVKIKAHYVNNIVKFKDLMKILFKSKIVSVDTETANLNRVANSLLTIQFSVSEKEAYVLPYLHKDSPFSSSELKYIRSELRKFFMQKIEHTLSKYLIFYNAKFDLTVIRQALGIPFIYWPVYDCMSGEHALDETLSLLHEVVKHGKTKVGYGNLAQVACTYGIDFYYTHTFAKADRKNIVNVDLDQSLINYAGADTQLTYLIHLKQLERAKNTLHEVKGKTFSYFNDFRKVVGYQHSNNNHCYSEMEHAGSYCDVKYLLGLQSENSDISKAIKNATNEIYKTKEAQKANNILLKEKGIDPKKTLFKAPFVFSLRKTEHKELLFLKVLKLEPVSWSKKTKKASLGKFFKAAYKDNPIVKLFNTLEKANKIKSTYVTTFIKALSKADGKDSFLRASFGFFDVLTGRANSSKPSFQQIPEHGDLAKIIKRIFVAPEGQLIVKLDYSAHEVRCLAIMSLDLVLSNVFQIGRDFRIKYFKTGLPKYIKEIFYNGDSHKMSAAFFFGVAIEQVTKILRNATKALIFGLIYGSSSKSIGDKLQSSELDDLIKELNKIEKEIEVLLKGEK